MPSASAARSRRLYRSRRRLRPQRRFRPRRRFRVILGAGAVLIILVAILQGVSGSTDSFPPPSRIASQA